MADLIAEGEQLQLLAETCAVIAQLRLLHPLKFTAQLLLGGEATP
jgi:hypothetical protein